MPNQVSALTLVLFQKDYFVRQKRVFSKVKLLTSGTLNYLPLAMVLEIIECDIYRRNTNSFSVTDGSEIVTIPRTGSTARREGVSFQIDPLIPLNREQFISFQSINRLFNVDLLLNKKDKPVCINQPGQFIITMKGDTLRSLSKLLNTKVKRLFYVNKNLKEPIASGIKVRIPTIDFDSVITNSTKTLKRVKIKQAADIAPGDLIFFRRDRYSDNRIGHVGLDIGNGMMLNTCNFPPEVTVTRSRSPFWLRRYVYAQEIL